ncbi:MAG: hypothetical protein M3Q15_07030 [Pseudomonadota bacterium]|nr:hypothetical protein [Pseudomonadota bacterium]
MSRHDGFDAAFDRIEEGILPSVSMMLDTLLDAATLGRPGIDADAYAAELRSLARELDTLTRQMAETITPTVSDYRGASVT